MKNLFKLSRLQTLGFLVSAIAALTVFSNHQTQAQAFFKPEPEDEKKAEIFKKIYPKENFVCLNATIEISFDLDSRTKDVTVTKMVNYEILSLKENLTYKDGIFYNDKSKVSQLRVKDGRGKMQNLFPVYQDYQSDGVFYSDSKVCSFFVEGLHKAEVFEVTYKYTYDDIRYFTSEFFTEEFPVAEKQIILKVPNWLTVEFAEFNFKGNDITHTNVAGKSENTITYTAKSIPAAKNESFSPGGARVYPHLFILPKSYQYGNTVKPIFASVDDLYEYYHSILLLMKNDATSFTPFVKDLIKGKNTDDEKIAAIFYWVQDNIRYIAFEDGIMGFKPDDAQNIYKNRYGDCKGMANLLTEMLKIAGYDARRTWIGTKSKPYDYSMPSIAVDNHMICTVILKDKKLFLDGTEDFIPLNEYANRIQGRPVLIENGATYLLDKIPDAGYQRNTANTTMKLSILDLKLSGKVEVDYDGEEKTSIIRDYDALASDDKEKAMLRFVTGNDNNLTALNIKTTDVKDRQGAFILSYDMLADNHIVKVGNEIYLDVDITDDLASMVIDTNRISGLDLHYGYDNSYKAEIEVPAAFKVDYLPEAFAATSPYISIQIKYENVGGKIVYTRKITLKDPSIPKQAIPEWNQLIGKLKKYYKDQAILVKK